jgi:hypothetical protein
MSNKKMPQAQQRKNKGTNIKVILRKLTNITTRWQKKK